MNQFFTRGLGVFLFAVFAVTGLFLFATNEAAAQGALSPREEVDESNETREEEGDDEVEDEEEDEDFDLDADADDLPVPVLFGIAANEIYDSFGDPRGGGSREHEGLDILAPVGTPVVSPTDAEVVRIGEWRGAGYFVNTRADGLEYRYFHLDDQAEYLEEGDDIEAGELIGYVGYSGNATIDAPHLHLEIRDDGEALNPYLYVTEDFTLEEKMDILDEALSDADDTDGLAELVAEEFPSVFRQATRSGLAVPSEVEAEMPDSLSSSRDMPERNLSVGSRGQDVRTLQQILIDSGDLTRVNTPTGYFGPITQNALASFQAKNNIQPATGYYGIQTRSVMNGSDQQPVTSNTESTADLEARITELTAQIQALRARINNQ